MIRLSCTKFGLGTYFADKSAVPIRSGVSIFYAPIKSIMYGL